MAAQPWWRVRILSTANDSYSGVDALAFRTAIGGANVAAGGTAIESTHFSGFVAANAFDGNSSTYWESDNGGVLPSYIGYHFAAAVDIIEVAITAHGTIPLLAPRTAEVQSSPDGVTWTTVWTFRGQEDWTGGQTRAFADPARITPAGAVATGGTVTVAGLYTTHTFTANGTLVVTTAGWFLIACIAGGGGGGDGQDRTGGGGGGGGVVEQWMFLAVGSYTITIGAGGVGGVGGVSAAANGGDTSGGGVKTKGGGHGNGFTSGNATKGGSGGGSRHGPDTSGLGIVGEGMRGGTDGYNSGSGSGEFSGAGGGGATQVGAQGTIVTGGKGGDGLVSAIDGNTYGGGGGGSAANYGGQLVPVGGAGGAGGGGAGGSAVGAASNGVAGGANTGGGGGGGGRATSSGGAGGSGKWMARYLTYVAPRTVDATMPLPLGKVITLSSPAQRSIGASLPIPLRASASAEHAVAVSAQLAIGFGISSTTIVRDDLVSIMPIRLGLNAALTHKDQLDATMRMPLGLTALMSHVRTMDATMALPFGGIFTLDLTGPTNASTRSDRQLGTVTGRQVIARGGNAAVTRGGRGFGTPTLPD